MYQLDGYNSINFFTKEEIDSVDTDRLIKMGYKRIGSSVLHTKSRNVTYYFYNPAKPYVYVQCYFANIDAYTQLLISRSIIDELNMIEGNTNVILITKANNDEAILYNGNKVYISRAFLPKYVRTYLTAYTYINIIDAKTTVYPSEEMLKQGVIVPKSAQRSISVKPITIQSGVVCFELEIIDTCNPNATPRLKEEGYKVRTYKADYFLLTKRFPSELDAWRAYGEYEKRFYKSLRFNPFTDYMSKDFDIAYRALILEELSTDDVIKICLDEWKDDWQKIMKLNLQYLYHEYGIPYVEIESDANGFARPVVSKKEE